MIKTIIFDFDGTLADTLPVTLSCVNKLAGEYGYKEVEPKEEMRNKSMRQLIKEELGLSLFQIPGYLKKLKPLINQEKEKAALFDGIIGILKPLSKKYTLFILTSNTPEIVNYVLGKNRGLIDFVFTNSSLFGKHKFLKKILQEKGLSRDEVLYIGDEIRDIKACKKTGIKIVAVTWGYDSKRILVKEKPDFLVDRPKDILKTLL